MITCTIPVIILYRFTASELEMCSCDSHSYDLLQLMKCLQKDELRCHVDRTSNPSMMSVFGRSWEQLADGGGALNSGYLDGEICSKYVYKKFILSIKNTLSFLEYVCSRWRPL